MESIMDFGISLIVWFQNLGDWLVTPMKAITFLGNEEFYLIIAPAIFWCVDVGLGLRVGAFLMINGSLISLLKFTFLQPRPYWYDLSVEALSTESSFGLPSGHAQNAVVVWGTLAAHIRRRWAWLVAIGLMFLIGLSRIYLGVHFPSDVVAGWLIGAVALLAFLRLEAPVKRRLKRMRLPQQVLTIVAVSICVILVTASIPITHGDWAIPAQWVYNAAVAPAESETLNPLSLASLFSYGGAFMGLAVGAAWLFARGGFNPHGTWQQLVTRYVLGLIGVVIIWRGLGLIFPSSEDTLAYLLRYFRYALVGLWISALAPWLFIRLRLASTTE